jgi:hypothetical protein
MKKSLGEIKQELNRWFVSEASIEVSIWIDRCYVGNSPEEVLQGSFDIRENLKYDDSVDYQTSRGLSFSFINTVTGR